MINKYMVLACKPPVEFDDTHPLPHPDIAMHVELIDGQIRALMLRKEQVKPRHILYEFSKPVHPGNPEYKTVKKRFELLCEFLASFPNDYTVRDMTYHDVDGQATFRLVVAW